MISETFRARAQSIFDSDLRAVHLKTDRLFLWLLLIQWVAAICLALLISPYAWAGQARTLHLHVEIALFGGAIINALPITLFLLRPGSPAARQSVAITQMLWAAVFVDLTGGRIETHFHIFGSLAFISFYRDRSLLITATLVVAVDHLALGFFWPESVYGIANPEWWRFLEHAAWVIFEDIVLWIGCNRALNEMQTLSEREATLEESKQFIEYQVAERTEELRTSANRYKTLIENTSAVPWEVACDTFEAIYVAPQMQTIFGVISDQTSNFIDYFHPEDRETFRRFLQECTRGSLTRHAHVDSRIDNGGTIMHVRSFVADRHRCGSDGGIYGISIDVTQQKKMEQELIQAQKLESIGQLSAGIAHEINTPTQFIGDNVRFLQETTDELFDLLAVLKNAPTDAVSASAWVADLRVRAVTVDLDYLEEEVPKAIAQSLDGVARIANIVGAMKDFSHPAIERSPHDINRAIASTITVASNEWKYLADLHSEFDPALPQVTVMPGAFNQAILNMIVNAAHAIAAANAARPMTKGLISVTTRKIDAWAEIRIRDTGCGIPEKILDRIFDPFFTTKEVGRGTGQGLAIVHDVIVKKHHGTIAVESTVGRGTTFIVRVPLVDPDLGSVAAA